MPIGPFADWEECLEAMLKQYDGDEEVAKAVCGKLQAKFEHAKNQNQDQIRRQLLLQLSEKKFEELDGVFLVKNVKLLASGTWTDSNVGTPLFYSPQVLEKYAGNWIDNSLWSRHAGGLPRSITDKIGEVRNPHFQGDAVYGDLWLHAKTQASRDTVELIKAGLVNYVSVEHGGKERYDSQKKRYEVEDLVFGGVAIVNRGACEVCTIKNEGGNLSDKTLVELDSELMRELQCADPDLPASSYAWVEDPEKKTSWHLPYKSASGAVKCECVRAAIAAISGARTGKPMPGVPDSAKAKLRAAAKECEIETEFGEILQSWAKEALELEAKRKMENGKDPDIAALEAQLTEATKQKQLQRDVELEAAKTKIAELEQRNKEFTQKLAELEHDSRVKELQKQIAELSKQPVYHTKIGAGAGARELELDNEEFPAYTVKDFGE